MDKVALSQGIVNDLINKFMISSVFSNPIENGIPKKYLNAVRFEFYIFFTSLVCIKLYDKYPDIDNDREMAIGLFYHCKYYYDDLPELKTWWYEDENYNNSVLKMIKRVDVYEPLYRLFKQHGEEFDLVLNILDAIQEDEFIDDLLDKNETIIYDLIKFFDRFTEDYLDMNFKNLQ
jgi:hypothetical protein